MAEAAAMTGCPAAIVEMIQAKEIVLALLKKYRDHAMDLADACIVRMTELMSDCRVITLARSDFAVYRRNGRGVIPVIVPPSK